MMITRKFGALVTCIFLAILIQKIEAQNPQVLMCYSKSNWPLPEQIDPHLCTHLLIIGSCTLDERGLVFPPTDLIKRYTRLKEINPDLKILITLLPKNQYMSELTLNQTLIDFSSQQIHQYLLDNQLDGFDIDWEFPVWSGDARWSDRESFGQLLKGLREQFDKNGGVDGKRLLLTAAVVAAYNIADLGYDASALNLYLDYILVMNYDFHAFSVWRPFTGFNAPLHKEPFEHLWFGQMNSEFSTQHWLDLRISPQKLVFGIPLYGAGFELLDGAMHDLYSPATNASKYGSVIPYRRSCNYMKMKQFKYYWDDYAKTPYIVNGRQWLGVEDKKSVKAKAQWAKDLKIAGSMVFALDSDDYEGKCGEGLFPLTKTIKEVLNSRELTVEFVKFVDRFDLTDIFKRKRV